MRVRYRGKNSTLAHKGAGTAGQYGIDGSFYIFNTGQFVEVTNAADIEYYRVASKAAGSVFEIEKPEAVADKVVDAAKKMADFIKDAVSPKPEEMPRPPEDETKAKDGKKDGSKKNGTLTMDDVSTSDRRRI